MRSPDQTQPPTASDDTPAGFGFALGAYALWGFLPLYVKLVDHIPATEVVAHRVIWSVPIAGAVLLALGRTADLKAALRSGRTMAMAAVTAALISVNWMIYVWAVSSGRALDAALGYYINPIFSVFLAAILLGERLSRLQWAAVALAALAVAVLTWEAGQIPQAALGLTVTWGFYAYFKRSLPVGPNQGFLLEVLLLTPFAVAWIGWIEARGEGHFEADPWLLMGMGVVTAVPLILYANGAKRLRLATIGMLQYTAPTMILLLAVFVFGEELDRARLIAFPMIWAALALYTVTLVRRS